MIDNTEETLISTFEESDNIFFEEELVEGEKSCEYDGITQDNSIPLQVPTVESTDTLPFCHNDLKAIQGGKPNQRYHIDKNDHDAIQGANNPSADNPFATIADVNRGGTGGSSVLQEDLEVQIGDQQLGSIVSGMLYVKDTPLETIIRDLLRNQINPVIDAPYYTLSSNLGSYREIGETLYVVITGNFNRGKIYFAQTGVTQALRAGAATNYLFTEPVTNNIVYTGTSNISAPDLQTIVKGTMGNTYNSTVTYSEGPQPLDNLGIDFDIPLPEGTLSSIITTEGVYPIFATTVGLTTPTKVPLISMINTSQVEFTLVAEVAGGALKQKIWIAKEWVDAKQISNIQYWATHLNAYAPDNKKSTFTNIGTVNFNIQGNTVQYYEFVHNGPDRGSILTKLTI